jgi:ABC-2 type transport system permease protein
MIRNAPQSGGSGYSAVADWLARGRTYASLTRLAFQRQLAYRFANLSGLVTPALRLSRRPLSMKPAESAGVTNGFFGLLRAYVIIALFGTRPAVAGYSIRDAITYTGLAQALIAYIALWGWWDLMRSIRTGEVASDLSRPLDYFGYWCAQDCGRAAAQLLVRGLPIMVLYAIFFHISLPPTLHHWLALLTSLGLALLISFSGALLVYYPALFFLGKPDPLGLPPIMQFLAPLAGFGVLAVAFAFWNFGVRKYTSTGT